MQGKDDQTNDEQKVNERTRHPIRNESNYPKNNQNRREYKQHGRSLSGESLNVSRLSEKIKPLQSCKTKLNKDLSTLGCRPKQLFLVGSLASIFMKRANLRVVA